MRWLSQGLPLVAGLLLAVPVLAQADVQLTTLDLVAGTPHLASGAVHIDGRALPAKAAISGGVYVWAVAQPVLGTPDRPSGADRAPAVVAPVSAALPTEVALRSPYPNPLADRARIPFELPEAATVRLTVYDALGRQVAVLADGDRDAGFHEASLDATRLAPGVYHVRMTVGAFVGASRFTVVR